MHDKRQRVHLIARKQDIELHKLGRTILVELVVERGIALSAALELVKEVQDELGKRHIEAHLDRFARQVDHVGRNAAVLDGELHDGARVLRRADDLCLEVGFLDTLDARGLGKVLRAADIDHLAVGLVDVIVDRGTRGNEVQVELALQAFLNDFHVQQAQEAHAEAKAERHRGLGLPHQRRVVDVQLIERVTQVLVVLVIDREQARIDHGLSLAVAGKRLGAGIRRPREGIAHAHGLGVLQARDHVAHLADRQRIDRSLGGTLDAHAIDQKVTLCLHHAQSIALFDGTVKDAHRGDDTTILVEVRIQDECLELRVRIALGRRDQKDNGLQQIVDALSGLARDTHGIIGRDRQVILDLGLDLIGMGRGQVDLVDGRHNVQIGVHGERRIGDGLRLDTLGGIDDEHRALAGGQRTRDLIGKVHVARRIDEVELIRLAVVGVIGHANGIGLDRNAALALDIHGVEQLRLHVALVNGMGELEDAVTDRGLAMVDVRNNRKVADVGNVN